MGSRMDDGGHVGSHGRELPASLLDVGGRGPPEAPWGRVAGRGERVEETGEEDPGTGRS